MGVLEKFGGLAVGNEHESLNLDPYRSSMDSNSGIHVQ